MDHAPSGKLLTLAVYGMYQWYFCRKVNYITCYHWYVLYTLLKIELDKLYKIYVVRLFNKNLKQ